MRASPVLWTILPLALPASAQHLHLTGDVGDVLGIAVTSVPDLDADGVRDILVGASLDGTSDAGGARVHSGANGALLLSLTGEAAQDQFGHSVASAGDLDGDGLGDLIVGARLADFGGVDAGRVYVLSGADGAQIFVFDGDSAGEQLGTSVAGGHDVNADGVPDIIVGAPADSAAGAGAGNVRVLSGLDGAVLYTIDGESAGDGFGSAVAAIPDLNADGHAEIAVGAPYDDDGGTDAGRVRVFSGLDGTFLLTLDGQAGDELGNAISSAADRNGDAIPELIVSAWKSDAAGLDAGRVQVLSGADGAPLLTFDGVSGDGLGRGGAAELGDVDSDGWSDFVVGAPLADVNGANAGYAEVFSGADATRIFTFLGDDGGDWLGHSVGAIGDANGDGLPDVLVGAPLDEENGNLSGSAYVFLGHCWTERYCVATDNSSGGPAILSVVGVPSISANSMELRAHPCPRKQFGIFFYGPNRTQIPLGHGYLCVGGGTSGLQRLTPIVEVSNQKLARYQVDFQRPPMDSGPGMVLAGSTWNFQFWFRDPPAGAPTYNLSDALAISFCP